MLCSTEGNPGDMVAGENIVFACQAPFQGLWAPVIKYKDNLDNNYTLTNYTSDIHVRYSVPFTVHKGDTGKQLQTELVFGSPPNGAMIPPSNERNIWDNTIPSFTRNHIFEKLEVLCKHQYIINYQTLLEHNTKFD